MSIELTGIAASDGEAYAPARWIETDADLEQFQSGEILLARMTSPDWGTVFDRAAAVATMEGGMLCHAALVARESGIPAVVGLGAGLRDIITGSMVRVDGSEGLVVGGSE